MDIEIKSSFHGENILAKENEFMMISDSDFMLNDNLIGLLIVPIVL